VTDVFHHNISLSLWWRQDGGVFVRVQLLCFLLKAMLQRLVMGAGLDESDTESGEMSGYSEYKRNKPTEVQFDLISFTQGCTEFVCLYRRLFQAHCV